ncbi:MAG: HD domain-containing protein [Defluviitaleaceae bacterium]|nr:HD domain-containing protein [Defluviitaleaceae bacterium]MCL2238604.1 HD domain-containing protein [Defluviitaleaceae bacterium]
MTNTISINAAKIIERSMNMIDPRLMHHGKRVGYFLYRSLKGQGYSAAQLRDIALLGILHDVGAFKTEELDKMVHFETADVWGHSIYGYLFMKYFSPMKGLAPVLLFHHANVAQVRHLPAEAAKLALLTHLCDRADLFYLMRGDLPELEKYLEGKRGTLFSDEAVDLFISAKVEKEEWENMEADEEFARLLYETPMSGDAALDFMRMVIYSIDFRSPQTMLHTFAIRLVARKLAEVKGLSEEEILRVETAALLHDIGKMGTPLHILEGTSKLTDEEFAEMRRHVAISEEILAGCVDADILEMAVNHHERMDGNGYPKKLSMADAPLAGRLLAVADVLSALWGGRSYKDAFPKERVLSILGDMRGGHLDAELVDMAITHYDELADAMARHTRPIEKLYDAIGREQREIEDLVNSGHFDLSSFIRSCYA